MTKEEFIEQIACLVIKYAPTYNIAVHSPIIAQAILESGYGSSELAMNAHNYFGLKYRKGRCPSATGIYKKVGSEQNPDGTYISESMEWCQFPDMENGVKGYFEFTNIQNYANLKGVTDPETYLKNIKADGYATSIKYVDNLMAVIRSWNLTKYDNKEVDSMSNSPLVNYTKLSPNHSGARTHSIDRISPHCVVGQCSVETLGQIFAPKSRQASCNYGIGGDGRIGMYVEEKNRSWCTSSNANDQRAVTIECASDTKAPYAFRDVVYQKLIDLCVDICRRNGKTKLLWISDKDKALAYKPKADEMILTVHRWFANKSCPGDWLMARMSDLAKKVTARLGGSSSGEDAGTGGGSKDKLYRVQVGAYSKKENANNQLKAIKAKGFEAFVTQADGLYKVQVGAYKQKSNADNMLSKIKAAGFDAFITTQAGQPVAGKKETPKKSVTEIAKEVIAGKWGNGDDRKKKITAAGYDYSAVQKKVNELMK